MTQCEICGARTGLHGFSFENEECPPDNEPEQLGMERDEDDR